MKRRPVTETEQRAGAATGPARVGRSVAVLLPHLRPGDVAVLDQMDVDRSAARALADAGVVAVVNASPSISGRFPNLGPELLAESGIAQVDMVGVEILSRVRNGDTVSVLDGNVYRGETLLGAGRALHASDIVQLMAAARRGLETQLQSFTANTVEFLRREQGLILHGDGLPTLRARLKDRPVLVVVAGFDYAADLKRVRRFVREQKPVVFAVDGGADAAKRAGMRPDVLVLSEAGLGARTTSGPSAPPVSDKSIRSAREIVLVTDLSGQARGSDRLDTLGVAPIEVRASAAPADVAILIADQSEASLIVTAGVHATLDEFLDRHRSGMASTFLTHLRVGPKLVSAAALPQVYLGGVRRWEIAVLLLAGVAALAVAVVTSGQGADLTHWTWTDLSGWYHMIRGTQ